jgi:hypothetical protein
MITNMILKMILTVKKIQKTTRSMRLSANRFAKDHFLILQQIVDESILSVANNAGVSFDKIDCAFVLRQRLSANSSRWAWTACKVG